MLIHIKDLKPGDLIFTVSNRDDKISGHVAIVYKTHQKPKNLRIIHATNSPFYFSLSITKINPSSKLKVFENHYEVIRCTNEPLLKEAMKILEEWARFQPPFDQQALNRMNCFNDKKFTIENKMQRLRRKFHTRKNKFSLARFIKYRHAIPLMPRKNGLICSSAILIPFQIAALMMNLDTGPDHIKRLLPLELQLSHDLVSPTILLNSMLQDKLFVHLGRLDFEYNPSKIDDAMIETERKHDKEMALYYRSHFSKKITMPESFKGLITGKSHPETNMIRTVLLKTKIKSSM